jgi:hypothetical protein
MPSWLAGNNRPAHPLPPQSRDLADPFRGNTVPATPWRRTAVTQLCRATASVAGQPAIALPLRYAGRFGRFRHSPTKLFDPSHQQESTLGRQARILMDVHPGDPPITSVSVATHSLTGLLRMNNLHSNHT